MKTVFMAIFSCALLLSAALISHAQDEPADEIVLFDGTNLDHWLLPADSSWRIEDQLLVSDAGEANHLVSRGAYDDFELNLEFWIGEPGGNSGVFIRCADLEAITSQSCYEVNIYDKREDPTYRSGAIVNVSPPLAQVDTLEHWNTYQIRAEGTHFEVRLNGVLTANTDDNAHDWGHIGLQYGGAGTVKFRNITITPL